MRHAKDAPDHLAGREAGRIAQQRQSFVYLQAQVAARLVGMGIRVLPSEILTSAEATGAFLAASARPGSRVFVIGEDGLRSSLEAHGLVLADDPDVDYVVVGIDRGITYHKLTVAVRAVLRGAQLVGPNPDVTLPVEDGLCPGAGALQAAISAATGVAPVIVGKPEPTIFSIGLKQLGCAPHEAAMIGDRLDTDVLGGQRAGLTTVLVLSGIATADDAAASPIKPSYVFQDIADLGDLLRRAL